MVKNIDKKDKKMTKDGLLRRHHSLKDVIFHQFYIIKILSYNGVAKVNMQKQVQLHKQSKTIFAGINRCDREKHQRPTKF